MNKEFIPYEQALALKELDFDEPCFGWFTLEGDGAKSMFVPERCPKQDIGLCLAPTYSQAFRWFREKHNLHSHISLGISDEQDRSEFEYDEYTFVIEGVKELDFDNYGEESFYKTPEEAELACLKKLIEIVKQK